MANKIKKLPISFYTRNDVLQIGKELIGKFLMTKIDGKVTGGIITETESYAGATDKASHAYNNKRTKRNEVMFHKGGATYVYLCYGIHNLFNVVTNVEGIPHAVLIRSIIPKIGFETILKRRNKKKCIGPGTVTKALGINRNHNGLKLIDSTIWIEDRDVKIEPQKIITTPRIGIDYAGEDAKLPWRFIYEKCGLQH